MNKPQDYYFCIQGTSQESDAEIGIKSWAIFVPKNYWAQEKCVMRENLVRKIAVFLPDYLCEEVEATFSSDRSPEDTREDLLKAGFEENDEFAKFCLTNGYYFKEG